MNKTQYIDALKAALSHLNEEEQEAALSFCAEMLEDRMESGMTEEEAVSAMEAPEKLAEKLVMDMGRAPEKAADPKPADGPAANPNEWQQMVLTSDADRLNRIDLQAGNMAIKVLPAHDGRVTLTYFTRPRNVYEAKVDGTTLSLREVSSEKGQSFFNFSLNLFNRDFGNPRVEITLMMPEEMICELLVQTRNGGVSVRGLQMLTHADVGTTNGGIGLENIRCISLNAHTTNGGLSASQIDAKKSLALKTTNGGTAVNHCSAGTTLSVRTSNGGVNVHHCTAGEALSAHTTNGALHVSALNGASITLQTSNSNITGSVCGPQTLWQIDSHTTHGRNSLPGHQDGRKPLSVHTTNGSIRIDFEG